MTDALTTTRQCWMGILARASRAELEAAMRALADLPPCEAVRPAETGTVMVEGRAGGTGRRFNLGEAVVTRCTVRMGAYLGFSYCLGRDRPKALLAAQLDALLQDPARNEALLTSVIEPLKAAQNEARTIASRKAAATRAEFFHTRQGGLMNATRDPGHSFTDPVFDAQASFRTLLDVISEPGKIRRLAPPAFKAPEGLSLAAAVCLLTLTDRDTPVWLDDGKSHSAAYWLAFHAGVVVTDDPAAAAFAVVDGAAETPRLCDFSAGEDRYPERSATLIVLCESLEGGLPVQISGPGIKDTTSFAPRGLRPGFWDEVRANADRFPLGVDLFFAAGESIAALPRTSQVSLDEEAHRCT